MIKKIDFLLVYEHKMRELENLCLLAVELENRGYSTEIVGCMDLSRKITPIYDVEVIIVPGALNNISFNYYLGKFVKFKKIISMPCEQVIIDFKNALKLDVLETLGKDSIFITWGDYYKRHLIELSNCIPENIEICGHISMDFWKEGFHGYYNSDKSELAKRNNLDVKKKWNLFISSLVMPTKSEKDIVDLISLTGWNGYRERYKIEVKTQNDILMWFENLLKENRNEIIIYRPHPAEINNQKLTELENRYSNFRVIDEGSVRQWIALCNRIFTWSSTSIVDVYFAKKNCYILRPVAIPNDIDVPIYIDASIIKDEGDFKKIFISKEVENFPLNMKLLSDYYDISDNYSFKKVANVCEKVIEGNEYNVNPENLEEFRNYQKKEWQKNSFMEKVILWIKNNDVIFKIYLFVIKNNLLPCLKNKTERRRFYREERSSKEILSLKEKIRPYVDKLM